MKRFYFILILIFTSIVTNKIYAQDLSKLSEKERNQKLIEMARAEYSKEKYKSCYRIYKTPSIGKSVWIHPKPKNPKFSFYILETGDVYYLVEFPYDKTKDDFEKNYAAIVYIQEKTGKVFSVGLGNGIWIKVE